MGHLKIVVDHDKLEYNGPFDANHLLRMIENHLWERGFDKRMDKDFEHHTASGKHIEWQYAPWKKITDYVSYIVKIRILGYDIVKVDTGHSGKKSKIDAGRIIITIDGFIQYDYDSYWDDHPVLHFLRTVYDYFVFKAYTERFEHQLVNDVNHLNDHIEKFLNLYRHYSVRSAPAP